MMTITTDNQFSRFWDLGYRLLVPIIPPDAELSETSTLALRLRTGRDPRGKTPGERGWGGRWTGFDWARRTSDETDLVRWHAMGAGVGIKTGPQPDGTTLVLIDADTIDVDCARIIRDTVEQHFGRLAIRIGRYPKAGYLIRADGDLPYSKIEFGARNERGALAERVELLTGGKQFVAEGIHPVTRQPYVWTRGVPALADVPVVTPGALTAFLAALKPLLPGATDPTRGGASGDHVNQDALRGQLADVTRAIRALPNTTDRFSSRESWLDVGYALKAALPDTPHEALALFQDWSAKWEGEWDSDRDMLVVNEPSYVEAEWARMKPPFRRGAGWLYEIAEKMAPGQFSQIDVWFDAIEDTPGPFDNTSEATASATAASAGTADVFPVLRLGELIRRPPPTWLIERHLPQTAFGFLYAHPAAYKSFLALDMALHIAFGRPAWHGDAINAPADTSVVYIAAEGGFGLRNRVLAWCQHHRLDPDATDRFVLIEQTVNFLRPEDVQKLDRTVRQVVRLRPVLIVVDTVSRAIPGADENLQGEMTPFVEACEVLKRAYGCAVLGVHHAGKSGDLRGSSVLRAAGDFVFRLDREEHARIARLTCEKQKDGGEDGWAESYRLDKVVIDAPPEDASDVDPQGPAGGDQEGDPAGATSAEREQSSLVPQRLASHRRADDGAEASATVHVDLAKAMLAALQKAATAGEHWSKEPRAKDRFAVHKMMDAFRVARDEAKGLLAQWLAAGLVHDTDVRVQGQRSRRGLDLTAAGRELLSAPYVSTDAEDAEDAADEGGDIFE